MTKYTVFVPPTNEQVTFKMYASDERTTVAKEALLIYNRNRAFDGQTALKRMPNGTTYTKRYKYEIQGNFKGCSNYSYGYECVETCYNYDDARKQQRYHYEMVGLGILYRIVRKLL